jgi:sortase A
MRIHSILNGSMLLMIAVLLGGIHLSPQHNSAGAEATTAAPLPATPVRIRIPARGIDARVEPVGLTKTQAMDMPKDTFAVGWYAYGAVPGSRGSAVFAGHRDTLWGTPGVFWVLREVERDDVVTVETATGEEMYFRVHRTEEYPADAAPIADIFAADGGHYVHLITCAGRWNRTTYDTRLVVFAEQIDPPEKTQSNFFDRPPLRSVEGYLLSTSSP